MYADIVTIFDGIDESAPLLLSTEGGKNSTKPLNSFIGSWLPNPVRTSGSSAFILFISDQAIEYTGFTFRYQVQGDQIFHIKY